MTWLELVLLIGAAYRLTRLVAWDDLTHPLRTVTTGLSDREHAELAGYVDRQINDGQRDPFTTEPENMPVGRGRFYLSRLLRCPWCVGFWISLTVAAVAAAADVYPWAWTPAVALTTSAAVGFTAKWLDT